MHNFLKIETQMFPAERIEKINFHAAIGGDEGIEVKLFGLSETFQYTGNYANIAWEVLHGVTPATNPPAPTPAITVLATLNGVATPVSGVEIGGEYYRFVTLNGQSVNANDIEWVDFNTNIGGTQGIELRVATDAPGTTRQFVGQQASDVYDVLAALASNQQEAAATN